jgi:O-antigen chain-terminating methyltransferase
MADTPPRPAPIPPPDRHQIEHLNAIHGIEGEPRDSSFRGRLFHHVQILIARVLARQREFNAAVVDHLNRNDRIASDAHAASARALEWTEQRIDAALDELRRYQEALMARDRRNEIAVAGVAASQEELRASIGSLQQAAQSLKREVSRLLESGLVVQPVAAAAQAATAASPERSRGVAGNQLDALDSHKYVGFEDRFRGSTGDIRQRVSEYLPFFEDARDVLDMGCGRGEFLALLRDRGVEARGIDINGSMVDVCRQQGLDATEADALTYLRAQPDRSIGGLFAAQVVEHLEPRYLTSLLDAAFDKLRPGSAIVLETINPACWFAFFESYIRDITHVRPIHPDTLTYLLIATGFQHVDVRYRSPYPEHDKLQRLAPHASLGDAVDTLNANVERINRLLFTWLDYAAIGRRP